MIQERLRLREAAQRRKHWKRWGPYVSERAWGTVREDYSATGKAWEYFPHDHARSRAYRWNEDGLAGICDRHQVLCFALALWNEHDPILKERLFGLTGSQGNHGEDVKEYYFYLDSTPTHSYMKFLYKYQQSAYPYQELIEENARRGGDQPEFELLDTGLFDEDRYFDVFVEYAKADYEDICIRIRIANRGPEAAQFRVLPTLWFRNTWSWDNSERPLITTVARESRLRAESRRLDAPYALYFEGSPELLFTENDTNLKRLYGVANQSPYVKDAFHEYIIAGNKDAVNPALSGTKAALHYRLQIPAYGEIVLKLRLAKTEHQGKSSTPDKLGAEYEATFAHRIGEADEFYNSVIPEAVDSDTRNVLRQAYAGLLWGKQYYHFDIRHWLAGDPAMPPPPSERKLARNYAWPHLYNEDVISMPDKWEYPWYAAWDLAFHCVALAHVDPDFAKEQLLLMLREWYMHPNGQLPAYEWAFGDVNPPVHAWAALAVYEIDKKLKGGDGDVRFLERVFHKLLLNFNWWVNRKDAEGQNVFQGGFLGLDNIGVFDRSAALPSGGHIEQSDGTSWMAMYCLDMLGIAFELARHELISHDRVYGDMASKFWEHFVYIARAMNHMGEDGLSLWNEEDGFFYDVLHLSDNTHVPLRVRSLVGLIPLYAVRTLEPELLEHMPSFKRRLEWFIGNRPDLTENMACMKTPGMKERRLFAIPDRRQLERIVGVMLDEDEFLSPCGIRSISQYHRGNPYVLDLGGQRHEVRYDPGEGTTRLFGGNSNWRGPVWMPVNFLLVESLRRLHEFYGNSLTVECPARSGRRMNLSQVADELCRRLVSIFQRDGEGKRPVYGGLGKFQNDPHWRDYIQFHEYFHGDSGVGVGASHQTGWTALMVAMAAQSYKHETKLRLPEGAAEGGFMKAIAVFPGKPNSAHLEELPMPSVSDVPDGRGVLVRVLRVGVDGTDKEINAAEYGAAPPGFDFLVLGHESFGQVVEVAEKVTEVKPGDYVVAIVRCPGSSIYDQIGTDDMTLDDVYYERGISNRHGFLTEYYVDNAEYVVKVPQALQDVGVLLEPLTIVEKGITQAYEIQRRLRIWHPKRAAVMGTGTVGLLATLALRLRGVEVTAFALAAKPNPNAELVEALGARYLSTKEVPIKQGAKTFGPFDLIFEATGASVVVFESIQSLGKDGVIVLSSITGGNRTLEVPADRINLDFVLGNKVMVGTVNANRDHYEAGVRDMAQAQTVYPGWLRHLMTHPVAGLENFKELFDKLSGAKGAIKVYCEVAA